MKITDWLKLNKLSLNEIERKATFFAAKPRNISIPEIVINGTDIEYVDGFKYLGIIVEKHLNWKPHTQYIIKKL